MAVQCMSTWTPNAHRLTYLAFRRCMVRFTFVKFERWLIVASNALFHCCRQCEIRKLNQRTNRILYNIWVWLTTCIYLLFVPLLYFVWCHEHNATSKKNSILMASTRLQGGWRVYTHTVRYIMFSFCIFHITLYVYSVERIFEIHYIHDHVEKRHVDWNFGVKMCINIEPEWVWWHNYNGWKKRGRKSIHETGETLCHVYSTNLKE